MLHRRVAELLHELAVGLHALHAQACPACPEPRSESVEPPAEGSLSKGCHRSGKCSPARSSPRLRGDRGGWVEARAHLSASLKAYLQQTTHPPVEFGVPFRRLGNARQNLEPCTEPRGESVEPPVAGVLLG